MNRFLILLILLAKSILYTHSTLADTTFPRLMSMSIGNKQYQNSSYQKELAKHDIVVLGFYRNWSGQQKTMREVVQRLKELNPDILVGQYGVMNELRDVPGDLAKDDIRRKVKESGWWLKNKSGQRVQWTTKHNAWEVNFLQLTKSDSEGKHYPQWLAERDYRIYHQLVPEFDFWYTDNVMQRPRVEADWDGDGIDDAPDSSYILDSWRSGYVAWWSHIRDLTPDMMIMGNADGDLSQSEFTGQLEGAFLEALMGKRWSLETYKGWDFMMERYRTVNTNLREPRIIGFNVWGDPKDYRFMRYALTSCLLGDAYFSFTDEKSGYSSVPWFDEYDVNLGGANSPPPDKPWQNGVWRRDFENGVVLVNPNNKNAKVVLGQGLSRFLGKQAPNWNNGMQIESIVLPAKDGAILVRK